MVRFLKRRRMNPASTKTQSNAGFFDGQIMKKHAQTKTNKIVENSNLTELDPETERKMRILANLIIDRIFEDKRKSLKFK